MKVVALILFGAAVTAAAYDPILLKLDNEARYQYIQAPDGTPYLADLWLKASDLDDIARYDPDRANTYHLFTRENPSVSQPLVTGDVAVLNGTNYRSSRRTVVLIHGWLDTVVGDFNNVLVPAILGREDVNLIVVDWSHGAGTPNYAAAVINTPTSGAAVARFISWLNTASGSNGSQYHLIGHNLGGHQVGIVGRHLEGQVAYITALDASFAGWITNDNKFTPTDGVYTEVIHTNAGLLGYLGPLGDVDFYPNGGVDMPGCISQECDHNRSFHYMAESIRRGGFTGTRCSSFITAMAGNCFLWGSLQMGGLTPKTGQTGVFHLRTNAFPPFSRG